MNGLSLVIPAYNEEKCLGTTLSSVNAALAFFREMTGQPAEVIVVDNASTDQTARIAAELGARVVRHDIRNIASVRNAGLRAASYDLAATVDADTLVPRETFVKIAAAMRTGKYVGGGVRIGLHTHRRALKAFVTVSEALVVAISGVSGGLFFFDNGAALAIGGFPETHLVAEDLAFAKSLRAYGRARRKTFLNLRSVTIETLDRKEVSFGHFLKSFALGVRAYYGADIRREDLGYWYDPKR